MLFVFHLCRSIAFYGYDFLVDSYNATLKIKQKLALILAYELIDSWFEISE